MCCNSTRIQHIKIPIKLYDNQAENYINPVH